MIKLDKLANWFAVLIISAVILAAALLIINPSLIGFVTAGKTISYNDSVNLDFTGNSEYNWQVGNKGNITSIKINGQYESSTIARVYLKNEDKKYLILDTAKLLQENNLQFSGFVVDESAKKGDKKNDKGEESNKSGDGGQNPDISSNETLPINETNPGNESGNDSGQEVKKLISIDLQYNKETPYDENDDGVEFTSGIIDLTVNKTIFSWEKDDSKLCTRWEVYSLDYGKSTTTCYGSNECCALAGLTPSRQKWGDPLYLSYNSLGATYNNIVSSQIIYVNNSSNLPDIVLSNWSTLSATFRENGLLSFENACSDTCLISGFNSESYKLIVEVDSGRIILTSIGYSVAARKENNAPHLIKNIENLTIRQDSGISINLSGYFSDEDNDALSYNYYGNENFKISFDSSIATIVPNKNFTGILFTFFTANDSVDFAASNVLAINISKEEAKPKIKIKSKDFRPDEDISIDFEYITKKELEGKGLWKEEYEAYEDETNKTSYEISLLKQKLPKKEKFRKKFEAGSDSLDALVYDREGRLKNIDVEIEELREGKLSIKVLKQRAFKAGRYSLKLDLVRNGVSYSIEQNFTWGVLALNLNKSIYLQNDNAFISIGVLDDEGKIVCNADVNLEIISPSGIKTVKSTSGGSIAISPECPKLGVTELPDYYTEYSVLESGHYLLNLTAITSNGMKNVEDSFNAMQSAGFDVSRKSATRIYPLVPYNMNISIIANQNYNGFVNEYVPSSFAITPQNGLTVAVINDTSVLSWDVKLKKNEKIELSYEYDAPDISPEFYLLGPLSIGDWNEARQWQIANDAPPSITLNYTIPTYPMYNKNVTFVATVTDPDSNLRFVNFTVIAPNGTIYNLTNGSGVSNKYNASINLTSYGTWRWNTTASDTAGEVVQLSTGQIILMQITENLNSTTVPASSPV
ncbi:MAG: hypothetical protein AABX32_04490, partial [Nanoarchaeota archaeon]